MKDGNFLKRYIDTIVIACMFSVFACMWVACKKNVCASDVPVPTVSPTGPTTFCQGGSVLLNVSGIPGSGYSYQWQLNGNDISGATGASYSASTSGQYQVRINETSCTKNQWSAPVTVNMTTSLSAVITVLGSTDACQGNVVLYANTCSGYTYKWKRNGEYIEGAEGATYAATQTGDYQLQVTMATENAWSALVKVTSSCQ